MNDDHIVSLTQLDLLIKSGNITKFKSVSSKEETYEWISNTLSKWHYSSLKKKKRSCVKKYIIMMTGYSEGSIDKLICKKKDIGKLVPEERTQYEFPRKYTATDIELLAEVANATINQNGRALKEVFVSMYHDYHDVRFEKLAQISVSHLYNLKQTAVYDSKSLVYTKTNPVQRNIGIRKKPDPCGKPGHVRVDSVHQGDKDKEKGVYHINLVDEVTQHEIVVCVEGISEMFLLAALREAIESFPFIIINFHSDNGSEYINHQVSDMLNKMNIEQTKSRARHSEDNALAEGKNGAIVRKYMGYIHIPKQHASAIDNFYKEHLNPYLNFHRFCLFPTAYVNEKGKIKKKYEVCMTPVQKLLSLPHVERYLRDGVTITNLREEMMRVNHVEAAKSVIEEKKKMFKKIKSA